MRGRYLATAANAVDHTVERGVLLVDWIVRIHRVFLRGHLIGARLAVADRCGIRQQLLARVRRWRCGSISRTSRLRNRHRSVDQGQQHYRRDHLSHDGSPELGPPHDHGNGKPDHKVRQASRFVQMLKASPSLAFSRCPAASVRRGFAFCAACHCQSRGRGANTGVEGQRRRHAQDRHRHQRCAEGFQARAVASLIRTDLGRSTSTRACICSHTAAAAGAFLQGSRTVWANITTDAVTSRIISRWHDEVGKQRSF